MNTIKTATAETKKRKCARTQEEYVPINVKDPTTAMKAFYHLFMGHSIDFCEIMLDVLSEKYEISRSDMLDVVMNDPRTTKMLRHPILDTLGYFTDDDLATSFEKLSTNKEDVPTQQEQQPQQDTPVPKQTIRIKKPKLAQTSSSISNPLPQQELHLPSQGNPQ